MSIGETLAEERERAGLSVTQVSLQTRIRETVIRRMEADDFALCGGNFYARGHIRSIARVIGIDPEPLVAEFDAAHGGAPQPVSALSAFEPEQPVEFRERRSPNWTAAMALALALVMVYVVVQVAGGGGTEQRTARQVAGTPAAPSAPASPTVSPSASPTSPTLPTAPATPKAGAAATPAPRTKVELAVQVKRRTWFNVRGDNGRSLFTGILMPGDERAWAAKKRLTVVLGVGGSVEMTVNGKDIGAPGDSRGVHRVTFTRSDPET